MNPDFGPKRRIAPAQATIRSNPFSGTVSVIPDQCDFAGLRRVKADWPVAVVVLERAVRYRIVTQKTATQRLTVFKNVQPDGSARAVRLKHVGLAIANIDAASGDDLFVAVEIPQAYDKINAGLVVDGY